MNKVSSKANGKANMKRVELCLLPLCLLPLSPTNLGSPASPTIPCLQTDANNTTQNSVSGEQTHEPQRISMPADYACGGKTIIIESLKLFS